jgi:hypothetical protein
MTRALSWTHQQNCRRAGWRRCTSDRRNRFTNWLLGSGTVHGFTELTCKTYVIDLIDARSYQSYPIAYPALGRNRRRVTITGTSPRASETSVWQLAFLPNPVLRRDDVPGDELGARAQDWIRRSNAMTAREFDEVAIARVTLQTANGLHSFFCAYEIICPFRGLRKR